MMKPLNPWKMTSMALALMLGLTVAGGAVRPASADEQPRMHAALDALRSAEASLQAASTDKGGHRNAALKLTRDAIEQVKKGIAYDNTHDGEKKPNP